MLMRRPATVERIRLWAMGIGTFAGLSVLSRFSEAWALGVGAAVLLAIMLRIALSGRR